MAKILVVGGAGYIGSHMTKHLLNKQHEVVVLDNLSTGYRQAVVAAEFVEGDISDLKMLNALFKSQRFDAVMHFASYIQVGESVIAPGKYYANNVAATINLLEAMVRAQIKSFIFSSTAAVYGTPHYVPIDEEHPKNPINPYGRSKWIIEQILSDFKVAHGLQSVCLRYFNAAGADPQGELGERHEPETHLIPLVLQAASGRKSAITVYGRDYDTPDGTCIRDYVHVADLVNAHALALDYLLSDGQSAAFNLGNGQGFSVQEVIDTAERVTRQSITVKDTERRPGDPSRLVADTEYARKILGWTARYVDLDEIIEHAWAWERKWPWNEVVK